MTGFAADLFDRLAEGYDQEVPFFAAMGERLVSWARPAAGARVLDMGAGRGAITRALVDAGAAAEIVACDISPAMVRRLAALHLPSVRTRVLDA